MKICVLGPAHPYRGGLAAIMETMARVFARRGDDVSIKTFTLQYPSLLFPGKNQTVDTPAPADIRIERCVNTVNPFNWIKIGLHLRRECPDFILLKYWTPFMAPCFGTIARIARGNGHTKVICQIDNVEPHEPHITDRVFNRYFLKAVDGFVYMSDQVRGELRRYTSAPALFSPHPMFENLGERVERSEACRHLGLDAAKRYMLFFGLVRDYKGLDILLDAWKLTNDKELVLLVAGEFYTSREKYMPAVEALGDRVVLYDSFVADEEVKYWFSVADAVVLPYRSATQSGVTQVAYNFGVPMIVTDVGGLAEIVPDGRVGYVVEPSAKAVAAAVERICEGDNLDVFRRNMQEERRRFSWEEMCNRITEVYNSVATQRM